MKSFPSQFQKIDFKIFKIADLTKPTLTDAKNLSLHLFKKIKMNEVKVS